MSKDLGDVLIAGSSEKVSLAPAGPPPISVRSNFSVREDDPDPRREVVAPLRDDRAPFKPWRPGPR